MAKTARDTDSTGPGAVSEVATLARLKYQDPPRKFQLLDDLSYRHGDPTVAVALPPLVPVCALAVDPVGQLIDGPVQQDHRTAAGEAISHSRDVGDRGGDGGGRSRDVSGELVVG